ncbi:MAG: inositol monophosphatase family protein [Candidatus Diapherotrites archaeon]|nr:inositol monophosphatase family protein [Candidatus Diapherotrites archaeon]
MKFMKSKYSFAAELAEKAGALLLRDFGKHARLAAMRGGVKEITTKFDKVADKMIVGALRKKFPEHGILSEESEAVFAEKDFVWVVDPIDGSSNYAGGNPFFAVSIALLHNKQPVFGAVYAPVMKYLFVGEEGKGAFLNGKRIHVSDVGELGSAYLLTCPGGSKSNSRVSRINAAVHPLVKDLRMLGSAALEGAWVACGKADAYATTQIYPWDIAAAVILAREAGGRVTDFRGNSWKAVQSDVIFSNGKVHEELCGIIAEAER